MRSSSTSDRAIDPYETLGVGREAGDEEIKRAYFRLVREHPPEREPERFREVRAAYDRIRTAERRSATNLFLLQPPPELPSRRAPSYDLSLQRRDVLLLAFEMAASRTHVQDDFHEPRLPE